MKIAIFSDCHDNLPNLEKFLAWCRNNNIDTLLFAGDLTTAETAVVLSSGFAGNIFLVPGNAEIYEDADLAALPNIKGRIKEDVVSLEIGGLIIGMVHQPEKIKRLPLREGRNYDFIFYGHTHKPWLKQENGTIIANPGNLAGSPYPATFAVLETETKNLQLKNLD